MRDQPPRAPKRVPLLFAAPIAAAGGVLLHLAYPGAAMWWFGFLGTALVLAAIWNQRGRHGLWLGAISGATFWLPLIDWLTLYLGPVPWAALAGIMVLWWSLMSGAIARVTRWLSALRFRPWLTLLLQAVAVAGLWVAREGAQSTFPYGGFAWGRLAHTQAEGPLLSVVSYTGFAGLSGLIVLLVALPVGGFFFGQPHIRGTLLTLCTVAAVAAAPLLPPWALEVTGTARIAAVQGNSKSGVFDDRENGDVIASHISATRDWLSTDPPPVDAIVWPENSAEFGLVDHGRNLREVRDIAAEVDAPLVVGSVLADGPAESRTYTNSSLVVSPESRALGRYDKRHPVPFAEYMPHRAFYRALAPSLVDMVQLEYEHGATDTVLPVGNMRAGLAICFDIVFDDMARSMSAEGAEIVFAQTNNADFGMTDQSEQQTFIAKLRAVEMGRTVVNISTVATSEIIAPSGETLASVPQWQPGVMEAEVPLVQGITPGVLLGGPIAGVFIALGALAFVLSLVRWQRSTNTPGDPL